MSSALRVDERGWLSFEHSVLETQATAFRELGAIERLSITKTRHVGVAEARHIQNCESIRRLWLWCTVTRGALRELFLIDRLEAIDVLALGVGKLRGIERAKSLRTLRLNCYMTHDDLLEIATSRSLQELGAQNANLNIDSIKAIIQMPNLYSIDLEATKFDDMMAEAISQSRKITELDIGATRVTRKGFDAICEMKQLKALDLWATSLNGNDLEHLRFLPNLEYVSIGSYSHEDYYDAEQIVSLVLALPALKRLWLDGIKLSAEQEHQVLAHLPNARIT